jgi:hypothetical protein
MACENLSFDSLRKPVLSACAWLCLMRVGIRAYLSLSFRQLHSLLNSSSAWREHSPPELYAASAAAATGRGVFFEDRPAVKSWAAPRRSPDAGRPNPSVRWTLLCRTLAFVGGRPLLLPLAFVGGRRTLAFVGGRPLLIPCKHTYQTYRGFGGADRPLLITSFG